MRETFNASRADMPVRACRLLAEEAVAGIEDV